MRSSRRNFLIAAGTVVTTAAALGWKQRASFQGTLLSAFEDVRGDQFIGGITLDSGDVFGVRVPMRAHGCAQDPRDPQRVVFFARRPGTQAFELRRDHEQARTLFTTGEGRHLSGHGLFAPDGAVLYVPEHDYTHARGVLTVRDARDFRSVAEIDTGGIDPHEIAWLPDQRHLLVANGGIMTHPRDYRRKLNIATMDPSLVVIDTHTGTMTEQWRLPDHQLSIRHLSVSRDGSTAVGLQFEGKGTAPAVVALYRPGSGLQSLVAPAAERGKFRGYIASIAIDETTPSAALIAAACPYGHGIACWSLVPQRYLGFVPAAEAYGVARLRGALVVSQRDGSAFVMADMTGRQSSIQVNTSAPIRWDDHWTAANWAV